MGNYVFFIGGSGARVYKSLIHSAAAGLLKTEELTVLLIDADKSNYANESSVSLYREYKSLYNYFKEYGGQEFSCDIRMESENVLSPVQTDAVNLDLAVGSGSSDRNRILKCFYTHEEINQDLKGGFYAHPNIGCIFFSAFANKEFNQCLNKIQTQLDNNIEVRIALVGSIFGGTGAAGIPTIYKLISNKFKDHANYNKLQMGGIFLEPYFKVNGKREAGNKNIEIKMEDFYFNTYEALSYYRANKSMKFQSIYLLGQQTLDNVNNEYVESGRGQDNKSHIIELVASFAIDRFLSYPKESGIFGMVRKGKLDWKSFPINKSESIDMPMLKLAAFARAQAVFLTEVYEYIDELKGGIQEKLGILIPQWYKVFGLKLGKEKDKAELMKQYSISFMEWLWMINSTYDEMGVLTADKEIKLFGFPLKNVYDLSQTNSDSGIETENKKLALKEFQKNFNNFVDTASNVEYVLDKVLIVLSLAGIVSGHVAEAGIVGLFIKIISLVSSQKE